MVMDILVFQPIYQERVWGGRGFASKLGRKLPEGAVIGESWELVDRDEANSVIAQGDLRGMSLREILVKAGAEIMGPNWPKGKPFPILVKWLDCKERLSLQVHPPAAVALELAGEPKTENWYIVDVEPGAALLAGLKKGVTREQFAMALKEDTLEPLVCRLPAKVGDSLFVESGRLHAIDAGNLILEIQQNSDTTYRVYDWGRLGLDGEPRMLHVEASMKSIDFDDFEPELIHPEGNYAVLAESSVFNLTRIELEDGAEYVFGSEEEPRIISLVEGGLESLDGGISLHKGDNALVPYASAPRWRASGTTRFLVTDGFAG